MLKTMALLVSLIATPVVAQDKAFALQIPDALIQTGFIKHLLPRFSLKTGIRITPTANAGDAAFGAQGTPVFRQGDVLWHLAKTDGPHTDAFEAWLLSDIGKRTIEAFAPNGAAMFSAEINVKAKVQVAVITGDAVLGEKVGLQKCGRCHVVNHSNRMKAIGSTPSFALMRTFPDWQQRFETFFILKPHPAFTQVADVTEPFGSSLPSPIAPIEVTLDEIDAITAYVATIPPADLGAPIQSQ
jgi:mono/diheme cytochrome c family protein